MSRNIRLVLLPIILAIIAGIFGTQAPAGAQPGIGTPVVPVSADASVCDSVAHDNRGDNLPQKISCSITWVQEFGAQEFGGNPSLPGYVYVPRKSIGVSELSIAPDGSPSFCGYASQLADLHYCNTTVHVGQATFDAIGAGYSLAIIAAVSAHETGHHWETVYGFMNLDPIFMDARIFPFEQGADCAAGAAVAYWIAQGYLSADVAPVVAKFFGDLAGGDGEPSHGSSKQREAAVWTGLNGGGLKVCNVFLPPGKVMTG